MFSLNFSYPIIWQDKERTSRLWQVLDALIFRRSTLRFCEPTVASRHCKFCWLKNHHLSDHQSPNGQQTNNAIFYRSDEHFSMEIVRQIILGEWVNLGFWMKNGNWDERRNKTPIGQTNYSSTLQIRKIHQGCVVFKTFTISLCNHPGGGQNTYFSSGILK